jgi:hypothetical protein
MPYRITIGSHIEHRFSNKDECMTWMAEELAQMHERTVRIEFPDGSFIDTDRW